MANEEINTALEVLNQMFGREWQSREADKERAHKLMSMRVQSDENELEALNRRIERESQEVRQLETEHAKLTGFLKERNLTSDAQKIAGNKLGFYETKRNDKNNQLAELNKRAQELNTSMAGFINMRDSIASGLYEKFVGADKDKSLIGLSHMSPEERKAAIDHQSSLDQSVDVKLLDAALSQYASGTSKERFDMLYRQGMYNLAVKENERNSLNQAAEEAQATSEQSASQFKAEWSQFSSRLKNNKWAIGDEMSGKMSIPDVNATAKSVVGALDSMAHNVAELVSDYADENTAIPVGWFDDVTPEVKSALDRYREAIDPEERTLASYQILREVRKLPDLSQFEDQANKEKINYLSDMLSGVNMLMNAQRYLPAYATSDEDAALLNMRLEELGAPVETEAKLLPAHEQGTTVDQDTTKSESVAGEALSLLDELAEANGIYDAFRRPSKRKSYSDKMPQKDSEEVVKKDISAALDVIAKMNKTRDKGQSPAESEIAQWNDAMDKLANPVSGGTVNSIVLSYIFDGHNSPNGFSIPRSVYTEIASGSKRDMVATYRFVKGYLNQEQSKSKKNIDKVKELEAILYKLISLSFI